MVPSRKRRGLAEIQLRIAEFKSSGLSKAEFAARLGVHPLSMDRWQVLRYAGRGCSQFAAIGPSFVDLSPPPSIVEYLTFGNEVTMGLSVRLLLKSHRFY